MESFLKIRDGIATGAGLQADPDAEGEWRKTGTPATVAEQTFSHGFVGGTGE
jgi:hypothetical protein